MLDFKGKLLITIMFSLTQEESRSISENVTWGNRSGLRVARSAWPTALSSATGKGRTNRWRLCQKKRKRSAHLLAIHAGADALSHCKVPNGQEHPDAYGEGNMAAQDGEKHPFQRKIQGRHPPAKVLHCGFPFQEAQGE